MDPTEPSEVTPATTPVTLQRTHWRSRAQRQREGRSTTPGTTTSASAATPTPATTYLHRRVSSRPSVTPQVNKVRVPRELSAAVALPIRPRRRHSRTTKQRTSPVAHVFSTGRHTSVCAAQTDRLCPGLKHAEVHHIRCVLQLFGPMETMLCHLRRHSLIRSRHPGRRALELCLLGRPPGKSSQFLRRAQQRWHIVPRCGRWPLRTGRSVGNSCLPASCFLDRLRWKEYAREEETRGQKENTIARTIARAVCQRLRLAYATEPLKLHSDVLTQASTTNPNSCKSVGRICEQRSVLTPSVSHATTELDWGGPWQCPSWQGTARYPQSSTFSERLCDRAEDNQVQPLPLGMMPSKTIGRIFQQPASMILRPWIRVAPTDAHSSRQSLRDKRTEPNALFCLPFQIESWHEPLGCVLRNWAQVPRDAT